MEGGVLHWLFVGFVFGFAFAAGTALFNGVVALISKGSRKE